MRYIMVGDFVCAAWGLSRAVLTLFWAYLSHIGDIYYLLEAISL